MSGCRGLKYVIMVGVDVFRAASRSGATSPRHVQTFRCVSPRGQVVLGNDLDPHPDARRFPCAAAARVRRVLAACLGQCGLMAATPVVISSMRRQSALIARPLALHYERVPIKRALQSLQDRHQLHNPRVGRLVDRGEIGVRRSQCCNFGERRDCSLPRLPAALPTRRVFRSCNNQRDCRPSVQSRRQSQTGPDSAQVVTQGLRALHNRSTYLHPVHPVHLR